MFQNDLGAMYYIGEIIKKDFVQAKYWFEKSAGQGNNDALLNLALMYRDGKGVNKKSTKSYFIISKRG